MRVPGLATALALGLALLAPRLAAGQPGAASALYQWTDAGGVVRYTPDPASVPAASRQTLQAVQAGVTARVFAPAAPRPAAEPPPTSVEAAEAAADAGPADPWNAPAERRAVQGEALDLAPVRSPGPEPDDELDARIRELETRIARDEEALRELVSRDSEAGSRELLEQPELRDIAQRLPRLQAELRALEEERARRGGG